MITSEQCKLRSLYHCMILVHSLCRKHENVSIHVLWLHSVH